MKGDHWAKRNIRLTCQVRADSSVWGWFGHAPDDLQSILLVKGPQLEDQERPGGAQGSRIASKEAKMKQSIHLSHYRPCQVDIFCVSLVSKERTSSTL